MSKKVIIVSKTHLDLGFTNYASVIKDKYLKDFIPNAIRLAKEVNAGSVVKKFVWTTGSWLITECLNSGDEVLKRDLSEALARGDIAAHAMPFTTHTELLDEETLEYGMSLIRQVDAVSGHKTIAAKMTDVPGHTIALAPILARNGIKLLHIGVNGASDVPKTPKCFLWKKDGYELVVIYSGDYGGEYKSEFIDEVLYFDHTLDNHGVRSGSDILKNYNAIKANYPDYEVEAGTMDIIAEKLWAVKDRLPVITEEIGDTWIHGAAADPYKVGAMRELQRLKMEWLEDGSLKRGDKEYNGISDNLMCVAEHTWGMDMKIFFADYENYLRKDFDKARLNDEVRIRHIFRDFPQNFISFFAQMFNKDKIRSYRTIEKSWEEQREYIDRAVACMSEKHRIEATARLSELMPSRAIAALSDVKLNENRTYSVGEYNLVINSKGGIGKLTYQGIDVIIPNDKALIDYRSYGVSDYRYWFDHYTRDYDKTWAWAVGDFGRPLLKYADKKYKKGVFDYNIVDNSVRISDNSIEILLNLAVDDNSLVVSQGAPQLMQALYTLSASGLRMKINMLNKSANRLTESLQFNICPNVEKESLRYIKINSSVNPCAVVESGNRKLSAVEGVEYAQKGMKIAIKNYHSPLIALGDTNILHYDNVVHDVNAEGLAFILHDNVWGTNFPLWYEDNASFDYSIKVEKEQL